jgi:dihydroceramide fatty acyl 2-hydroxylase
MNTLSFHRGSARMFENNALERLSHVHPATPALIFVPVMALSLYAAAGIYRTAPSTLLWQMAGGYLAWTLFEYWLHRLLFHLPARGPISAGIYFFIHGVHHDWPWDTSRLVMPPAVSISLALLFYYLFCGIFGSAQAHGFFAGFVGGYLIYDTAHWYIHAGHPRTRWGNYIQRQHMIHHFRAPNTRFGVSCPWWDVVFRTCDR